MGPGDGDAGAGDLLVLSLPVIVSRLRVARDRRRGVPSTTVFAVRPRLLYVGVAFLVALSPYVLLSAYMLRILAVSKHSLDPGGFTVEG